MTLADGVVFTKGKCQLLGVIGKYLPSNLTPPPFTLNTTGNTRSRMGSRSATTTVESRPPRLAAVPIGQLENLLGKAHVATLMIETRCVLRRVTREYFLLNDEEPQEDE